MKALLLAGGKGTRLRPFTHSLPKQLVPVANKPVLVHCLEAIREIGVVDVGMIVGEQADQIQEAVGDGAGLGLRITYIPQDRPRGLAHCVMVAREFLGDDDFVMYLGDNMLLGGITEAAEEFRQREADASVAITKVDDPRQYGIVELDSARRIVAMSEKPENPRSDLAVMGVYFFTPAIHASVDRVGPGRRGELEITDAIQDLLSRGGAVTAKEYTGYWKDTGTVDDLLECNRYLLDTQASDLRGDIDSGSRAGDQVVVEPGARIIRSRLEGPLVIGTGTVVRDCRIGPHTSIGRDCILSGADIADSIVLDEAAVERVVGIRESVLGRRADVCAARDVSRYRLLIGDHSHIKVPA